MFPLISERGEGERNTDVEEKYCLVASPTRLAGNQTCSPPVYRKMLQPTEPPDQGNIFTLFRTKNESREIRKQDILISERKHNKAGTSYLCLELQRRKWKYANSHRP